MLKMEELTTHSCRWPMGDDEPVIFFCGSRCKDGSSYCPTHHALAYLPKGVKQKTLAISATKPTDKQEKSKMPMKGVIVVKLKDHVVPTDFWGDVFGSYSSCYGVATIDNGEIVTDAAKVPATLKIVEEIQNEFMDQPVLFFLGQFDGPFEKEDIPPYSTVLDADKTPLAVVALDGDFANFDKPKSTHPAQWHVVQEYLIPHMNKLLKLTDENTPEFFKELQDSVTQTAFSNTSIAGQEMVMLLQDGTIVDYSNSNVWKKFEWGFATVEQRELSDEDVNTEAANDAPKSGLSRLSKITKGDGGSEEPKKEAAPPPAPTPTPEKTEPEAPPPDKKEEDGEEWGAPPNHLHSKKSLRTWYENNNATINKETNKGYVPAGYAKRVKVKLRKKVAKSLQEAEPALREAAANVEDKPWDMPDVPVVSPAELDTIKKMMDKGGNLERLIDMNSKPLEIDPEKMQEEERKHPSLAAQLGHEEEGLSFFGNWPFEALHGLPHRALATLAFNLRNECLILQSKMPNKQKDAEPPAERPSGLARLSAIRKAS